MVDSPPRWTDYVPLDEIARAERNPKRHADADIQASIRRFGYVEQIAIDERTGRMVAGHGRLDALLAHREAGTGPPDGVQVDADGGWIVPVQRGWRSKDDAEAEAYLIASNWLVPKGGWDDPLLADMLADRDDEWLDGTGIEQQNVDDLLASLAASEPAGEPEPEAVDVPDPPPAPVSEPGTVWLLGRHRLVCGDGTDPSVLAVVLAGHLADMVWTDPPYGVDYGEKNRFLQTIGRSDRLEDDIAGDGSDPEALRVLLAGLFGAALGACRPGAVWFVAAPAGPPLAVFASELLRLGVWRQLCVWVKNRPVFGRSDYHYQHENLFYGWAPGAAHRPPPTHSTTSLFTHPSPQASKLHPTMKPVSLILEAVEAHTAAGEWVLDPCGGSGSTLMACEQARRFCATVEIDPGYADVICTRFQRHTGIVPIRESTGEPHDFLTDQQTANLATV